MKFKVIDVLIALRSDELKRLEEFIQWKPEKYRKGVNELYSKLCEQKNLARLSENELLKVTGNRKKRLSDLMNKLLVIVEEFCTIESIRFSTSKIDQQRYLIAFYNERNITFQHDFKNIRNLSQLKKNIPTSSQEYLGIFQYLIEAGIHEKINEGRNLSFTLTEYSLPLSLFYFIERIKLICERVNRSLKMTPREEWEERQILKLARNYVSDSPLLHSYLKIYDVLNSKAELSLNEFDDLNAMIFKTPLTEQSKSDILTLTHYLINIVLNAVKNDGNTFRPRFISFILELESHNLILENGHIAPTIFKIVISISLKDNNIVFAESFFKKYALLLPASKDEDVRLFCGALIEFHKKNYSYAVTMLEQIHKPNLDYVFTINVRRLSIQAFIEQKFRPTKWFEQIGDTEVFLGLIKNFRSTLHELEKRNFDLIEEIDREELLKRNIRILNFLSYLREIVTKYHTTKIHLIQSRIHKETQVAEKEWLLSLFEK